LLSGNGPDSLAVFSDTDSVPSCAQAMIYWHENNIYQLKTMDCVISMQFYAVASGPGLVLKMRRGAQTRSESDALRHFLTFMAYMAGM
jgi:hypothetical protein